MLFRVDFSWEYEFGFNSGIFSILWELSTLQMYVNLHLRPYVKLNIYDTTIYYSTRYLIDIAVWSTIFWNNAPEITKCFYFPIKTTFTRYSIDCCFEWGPNVISCFFVVLILKPTWHNLVSIIYELTQFSTQIKHIHSKYYT